MIKKLKIKNRGFSLLEISLYLAILSTLVFGIGAFVNLVSVTRIKNQTMTEVDQQAFQIIENVTQTIRNANTVVFPTIGQISSSLTMVDGDNNTVVFEIVGDKFTVNRGNGVINLSNEKVTVENLLFKDLSRVGTPAVIQINFTISYNNISGNQNYNYSKTYVASASLFK